MRTICEMWGVYYEVHSVSWGEANVLHPVERIRNDTPPSPPPALNLEYVHAPMKDGTQDQ